MAAFWSKERIDLALNLREQGLSAADIAEHIGHGCSRNGVLGVFHRVRAGQKKGFVSEDSRAKAAVINPNYSNNVRKQQRASPRPTIPHKPKPFGIWPVDKAEQPATPAPQADAPAGAGVLWAERRYGQCAFVLTDPVECREDFMGLMRCCGEPVAHKETAWCAHHHGKFRQTMASYRKAKKERMEAERMESYGIQSAARRLKKV